jgi:hypothetical protein
MARKNRTQTAAPVHACECGKWIATSGEDDTQILATACGATTRKTFAPGHDARLKGLLIDAGACGYMVKRIDEPVAIDPVRAAGRFGFGHMVDTGITNRIAKTNAKIDRDNARRARKALLGGTPGLAAIPAAPVIGSDPEPDGQDDAAIEADALEEVLEAAFGPETPAEAPADARIGRKIRVGRWTYMVESAYSDGAVAYIDRSGESRVVAEGKFRWV